MIYLDTSVALARLLAEDRQPPRSLWDQSLVSSRLLEYEVWNRIHSRRLARSHTESVRGLLGLGPNSCAPRANEWSWPAMTSAS